MFFCKMRKSFIKSSLVWLLATNLISCSSANNKPVSIMFSADSSSIVFCDIDPAGLLQVRNTPGIDTAYSGVISILEEPDDDHSTGTELPYPGKIQVTDTTLVFKPDQPFVAGRSYLINSYMNVKFADPEMMLKGKINHGVKPEQVILKR